MASNWPAAVFLLLLVTASLQLPNCCGSAVEASAARQTARPAASQPAFRRSGDLGVSRCSLLGVLGGSDVQLHVWLRVAPPSAPGRNTALVRGVAFLQDCRRSVPFKSPMIQMVQSIHLPKFSGRMYLRSPVTGERYPLQVLVPQAQGPAVPIFPNTRKMRATNHVMDVLGELVLQERDVDAVDFELRVEGFRWYCNVLVERPVLRQSIPATLNQLQQPAGGAKGQPSTGAGASGGTLAQADVAALAGPAHHVRTATLTSATEVWVLLAPFHGVSVDEYARTLWFHVLWHVQLGVVRYLLYVFERLGLLLANPLIQALVNQGVLEVVSFLDLPKHEHALLQPDLRDTYAMQVLQYNHAVLALWGSDTLLLVIDLDEYLVSSSPMTAMQIFRACAPEGGAPVAGVQLPRYDGKCRESAAPDLCDPQVPHRDVWIRSVPDLVADVADGRRPHPLTGSTFQLQAPLNQWDQKPLLDPGLAMNVHVHDICPAPGSVLCNASRSSVRLLHLLDFYSLRADAAGHRNRKAPPDTTNLDHQGADSPWMWPAGHLQSGQRGLRLHVPRVQQETTAARGTATAQ